MPHRFLVFTLVSLFAFSLSARGLWPMTEEVATDFALKHFTKSQKVAQVIQEFKDEFGPDMVIIGSPTTHFIGRSKWEAKFMDQVVVKQVVTIDRGDATRQHRVIVGEVTLYHDGLYGRRTPEAYMAVRWHFPRI